MISLLHKVLYIIKVSIYFIRILFNRIIRDKMTMVAASLSYTSILSLIPLMTILIVILSAFPSFYAASIVFKQFLFNNLVPTANENVLKFIESFMDNSSKMTAIGVIGLFITSILLMNSVDDALNYIWRSKKKRSYVYSFAIYWMILTLGPLLLGASIVMSSYLFSLNWFAEGSASYIRDFSLRRLPFLFSFIGFWIMYGMVPTKKVYLRDAFIGAFIAGVFFEISKKLFVVVIKFFPSYELIYGVIASIPILFVWIYVVWFIILFGAEIAATLNSFRHFNISAERDLDLKGILESEDD